MILIFFFNIIFYSLFLLFSAIAIPLLSLAVFILRLFSSQRIAMKAFRRAISFYGTVIVFVLPRFFIRVYYQDFSEDDGEEGPFIYVANHRSASDAFLMACIPGEIVQVVNTWPFKLPVLGIYARWAGYLSVREMPYEEFESKSIALLESGTSIVAFPEGTRSGDSNMGQFHGALFRVAQKARANIVPLCIMGNEDKPSRGTLMLKPGQIHINRLSSVTWNEYKDMSSFKLKKLVRQLMINHIQNNENK